MVGWEALGTDGGVTYNRMVQRRQPARMSKAETDQRDARFFATFVEILRCERMEKSDENHSSKARTPMRAIVAQKLKEAKTHEQRMIIAQRYHESLEKPLYLPTVPRKVRERLHREILTKNRTGLKFKKRDGRSA